MSVINKHRHMLLFLVHEANQYQQEDTLYEITPSQRDVLQEITYNVIEEYKGNLPLPETLLETFPNINRFILNLSRGVVTRQSLKKHSLVVVELIKLGIKEYEQKAIPECDGGLGRGGENIAEEKKWESNDLESGAEEGRKGNSIGGNGGTKNETGETVETN